MTVTQDRLVESMPQKTNRSVTKSVRMTTDEAKELSKLSKLLSRPNEASLLYEAYSRGLMAIKMDEAVIEYTRRVRSLGEVAELFGISSADLALELVKRNISMLDINVEQAKADLEHMVKRHFSS